MIRRLFIAVLLVAGPAAAHEVRPAHLTVTEVGGGQYLVRWKVPALGNARVAVDPVFDADCAIVGEPTEGLGRGASARSWYVTCGELAGSSIAFANLPATMIDVLVNVTFLDGRAHTGLVRPSDPVFEIPVRDAQTTVFADYFGLGVEHILFGWDHLLFVSGMLLLISNVRRLVWAITGFTIAHSVTLALAVFDVVRVPGPPVEAVIALSIVLLAVESMRHRQMQTETFAVRAPWAVSLAIGLVHGLGFAGALSEYGIPPHAQAVSLAAFNLGVEAGQLGFIAAALLLGVVVHRLDARAVRFAQTAAIYAIGVCGSFWLVQRLTQFFAPVAGA